MTMPKGPYSYIKSYKIPISGRPYGFHTLVSKDGVVAWMPDNEQQHVNPQFRGGSNPQPVWIEGVNQWDVGRIIGELLEFQTKESRPLEDIVHENRRLIKLILNDFKAYQPAGYR